MATKSQEHGEILCRCCHSKGEFKSIYKIHSCMNLDVKEVQLEDIIFSNLLRECFNIELAPEPKIFRHLLDGVCYKCIQKLYDARDFKQQVLKCELKFIKEYSKQIYPENHKGKDTIVTLGSYNETIVNDDKNNKKNTKISNTRSSQNATHRKNNKTGGRSISRNTTKNKLDKSSDMSTVKNVTKRKNNKISGRTIQRNTTDIKIYKISDISTLKNATNHKSDKTSAGHDNNDKNDKICDSSAPGNEVKLELKDEDDDFKWSGDEMDPEMQEVDTAKDQNWRKQHANNQGKYFCNKCDRTYKNRKSFLSHYKHVHLNLHNYGLQLGIDYNVVGSKIHCCKCEKSYISIGLLKRHAQTYHSNEKPKDNLEPIGRRKNVFFGVDYKKIDSIFQCCRCDKQFEKQKEVTSHVRSDHMMMKYVCTEQGCSKSFLTKMPLLKHRLDDHNIDERFKCNACDALYFKKSVLNLHIRSYHMLGKKYKCDSCDYECFSAMALGKHKFLHKSVKDYKCSFCGKAFLRKTTMQFHERIHTGDKRKVCKECGQAFVQKASLNYHMAKHHPGIPF